MTYLGTWFFFFENFQDDLGISPLGKDFPYNENYMPGKIVCHLKTVFENYLSVFWIKLWINQTVSQDQLIHSHSPFLTLPPFLSHLSIHKVVGDRKSLKSQPTSQSCGLRDMTRLLSIWEKDEALNVNTLTL